jgi:hypothetical protein
MPAKPIPFGIDMSRDKKTRRLKGKLNVKTGSKKNFILDNDMGKIPSKNKLAKHKHRLKSAYQKSLESVNPNAIDASSESDTN